MVLSQDTLATTTLQLIRKKLADNVFKANPYLYWLLAKGRVKIENGGKRIDEPLMYATNGNVMAYKGYDRLTVAPSEELTNAQFAWRQAAASIAISGLEELQNSGDTAVFNMLKAKIKVADLSLRQFIAEKILALSTTKDNQRDFLGLDELVENVAGATQGIIGGIDRSTETFWRNQFTEFADLGASTTQLTKNMNTAYLACTRNITSPDLILMHQTLYQRYEDDNRQYLRLTDTNLMDVGFMNFKFKRATAMWDENMQGPTELGANKYLMYFLNSEYLGMTIHAKRNFVMTPFVSPIDQDAKVAQILVAGNMTICNSRFQGAFNQTAT